MKFRFQPRVEWLEAREVPAVNWTWKPANDSVDASDPANWENDANLVGQIPNTPNDNVSFVGGMVNNKPCNLTQGFLGKLTVTNTYTSTIRTAATTFTESSVLGACTINLNGGGCDFGTGKLGDPATSTRVTITGGGSIFVTNLKDTDLAEVLLGSSVNVNAGGTLHFGNITFTTANTTSTFTVGGTAITDAAGANYFSYQLNGTFYQPIHVVAGGNLNFVSRSNVASYITCDSGAPVTVQGTAASPNVLVSITGYPSPQNQTGLNVSGILNLAAGSTISGNVIVSGGMNLFDAPAGGATVCTIADGSLTMLGTNPARSHLNLNNYTLSIAVNLTLDYCDVTTNLNYDAGVMGNITTTTGFVIFQDVNTLTQGHTGTPRTITLPLITTLGFLGNGDFDLYVLEPGVSKSKVGGTISLSHN